MMPHELDQYSAEPLEPRELQQVRRDLLMRRIEEQEKEREAERKEKLKQNMRFWWGFITPIGIAAANGLAALWGWWHGGKP